MSKKIFSFASILSMVAKAVDRSPADVSATGLSEDENQLLTDNFGAQFVTKFEAERKAGSQAPDAADLLGSLKAHFDGQVKVAIDEAFTKIEAFKKENSDLTAANNDLTAKVETLANESEPGPKAELPTANIKPGEVSMVKINPKAAHYDFVSKAMANPNLGLEATADNIDIVDALAETKTFLSQDMNNGTLVTQIFNGFTSAGNFRTIRVKDNYHKAVKAQINSVVQKFSKYFTPKGDFKFTPMVIRTFHHKINVVFTPAEIIDSYIDFLYDQSMRPDQMPIFNFLWNQLISPRILEDLEYRMVFKGKFDEDADPKAPTNPEQSMNGIETILVEAKASGTSKINFYDKYVDIATATDDQMIAHVNGFAQFIKKHKLRITDINCSEAYRTRYQLAYDNKYKGNSGIVGEINPKAIIDYSPARLVAEDGLGSSPIIYATIKGNKVKTRKKNAEPNVINDIQRQDYDVKIFGEFNMGVGFEIEEVTYACVPAGYDPQAELEDSTLFPDGTAPSAPGSTPSGSAGGGLG